MKVLYKELLRSAGLGIVIFVVLTIMYVAGGKKIQWNYGLLVNFLYVMLYSVTLYVTNAMIFYQIDKIFGKGRMTVKRLITGFFISFTASVLLIFLLRIFEDVVIEGEPFAKFIATETFSNYYKTIILTLVISLLVHALHFYRRYQENKVKEQKIIAGTASAKFETLKNQIDPHFLFNSLNVLSSLIEENPDSAQRFTTSLSKVYRYVLEQKDKELVSVEEELSFAKTYMNLLKMRFENSIFYEVQDIANPDAKVVPLSLQLLLENTIKHNVVSPKRPLQIRIFEKDGCLVVQNDLQRKEVLQDREGVGLQNIVSRYGILTTRKVQVEQTDKHFTVRLPILTKQLNIMETTYNKEESIYYKAQKKVEEIKGFYANLTSYVVIILGLTILNLVTYPKYLWFLYPAVGWGIGVLMHAFKVFNYMPFLSHDWEERKVKEIMEKEKANRWQ